MNADLSVALAVAKAVPVQQSMAIAMVKHAHEAAMAFAQQIDQVARAAPPPGQGKVVDKLA